MATNRRTFEDGINHLNGYIVNVTRFVSAYDNAENSRIAAHYWGTIEHPNGNVTNMGESGMTVTQIKGIIFGKSKKSVVVKDVNQERITELNKAKETLESLGLSTDLIDAELERMDSEKKQKEKIEEDKRKLKELYVIAGKITNIQSELNSLGIESDTSVFIAEIATTTHEIKNRLQAQGVCIDE